MALDKLELLGLVKGERRTAEALRVGLGVRLAPASRDQVIDQAR